MDIGRKIKYYNMNKEIKWKEVYFKLKLLHD